jgi:hypothetical protein
MFLNSKNYRYHWYGALFTYHNESFDLSFSTGFWPFTLLSTVSKAVVAKVAASLFFPLNEKP